MLENSVIVLEDISSSQAKTESVIQAALLPSHLMPLKEKLVDREARSARLESRGTTWRCVWDGGWYGGRSGEVEDEDVDVRGIIDEVGVSASHS